MSVGLHILYGVMGSGKTNFAVNKLLRETTYKNAICNVPLSEDFKKYLEQKEIRLQIFDKLEPGKVIDCINSSTPSTMFIVDESQLELTSSNVARCKHFAKLMSQIRQDDQDVVLIAQTAKMLPSIIKDVATDCYKFENNNIKGLKKSSHVEQFLGGYDYKTKLIAEFTYTHTYGNYSTSNWETTEKPKVLYKPVYIKLGLIILAILLILSFVVYKVIRIKNKVIKTTGEKENVEFIQSNSEFKKQASSFEVPQTCVRSWHHQGRGVIVWVDSSGRSDIVGADAFFLIPKCPLP